MTTVLEATDVSFGYSAKTVLHSISLTVDRGDVVTLLGPNGSGKTTLLKILLGLARPMSGRVYLEERPMGAYRRRERARRLAYIPQSHSNRFGYRVMDVVLMGRSPHQPFFFRYSPKDRQIALDALERLSIVHLKDRNYNEISGGERQLTLIARALAQGARTLIMDEPANGLDYGNQIRLLEEIAGLIESGYTFIMSTHFPDHALWIGTKVIMLNEGKVVARGKPDQVINEQTLYRLYLTEVDVISITPRLKMCVPRLLESGRRNAVPPATPVPLDCGPILRPRDC